MKVRCVKVGIMILFIMDLGMVPKMKLVLWLSRLLCMYYWHPMWVLV